MKKSRFTDSQIMDALKRADAGLKVPDLECLNDVADEGAGRRESSAAQDGR